LQVFVIVSIFVIGLEDIVIHVLRCQFRLDCSNSERLKLQHGHGACGILQECLIDPYGDFFAGNKAPLYQMSSNNLMSQGIRQLQTPCLKSTTATNLSISEEAYDF
jgi:hypothetical protein